MHGSQTCIRPGRQIAWPNEEEAMPSNGQWRQVIRPADSVTGIDALHRRADGVVTIWHQTGYGYRLTAVSPNGATWQTTGRTKQICRARIHV
jgi:hypothetical protein